MRNPFKGAEGLDERLSKVGMTRADVGALSKMTGASAGLSLSRMSKGKIPSSKTSQPHQSQETFLFDKPFWNKITPEHREGIREKYGITGDTPEPNKLYYPISRSARTSSRNPFSSSAERPELKRANIIPKSNQRSGESNEIRNI